MRISPLGHFSIEVQHELYDEGGDRALDVVPLKKLEQDQAGGSHRQHQSEPREFRSILPTGPAAFFVLF